MVIMVENNLRFSIVVTMSQYMLSPLISCVCQVVLVLGSFVHIPDTHRAHTLNMELVRVMGARIDRKHIPYPTRTNKVN